MTPTTKKKITPAKLQLLQAQNLKKLPWLLHAFSTRTGGHSRAYKKFDLNLGFTKDDKPKTVARNREAFLKALGARPSKKNPVIPNARKARVRACPEPVEGNLLSATTSTTPSLITLRQIHSDLIHHVNNPPTEPLTGDGLITNTPGVLLAIQTADCLPVILVDTKHQAIGVFHAGWRGTVQRIVEKGVGEMRKHFGTKPRDIQAAIGPGIYGCCYEVGEEVRTKFEMQFDYADTLFREVKDSDPVREKYPLLFLTARAPGHSDLPKRIFLDLVEANRRQLIAAGVPKKNIDASSLCTNCNNDQLFSYRAEKGKTGRLMAVAGIKR